MGNAIFVWVVYLSTYAFLIGYTVYLLMRLRREA